MNLKSIINNFVIIVFAVSIAGIGASFPQRIKKKNPENAKPAFVLMGLSAHPDDEDGATLAYYGKIENVKTYSVFFTRGEGGQNETGSELYDELGAVRTKETLEAAKIIGTQVCFLGLPDFGYSKTAKETFSRWKGKENVLVKLVYVIRCAKPDVIVTNHDTVTTKPRRQHGNHQAVGILAYEAFAKAADPKYHPEQLKNGVTPWQVKKLFFRSSSNADTTVESLVSINVKQEYRPSVLIEDIGLMALQQHRSQGLSKLTLDSLSPQFRKHQYRLIKSDGKYFYDAEDLFSGLQANARQTFLPKEFVGTGLPQFSLHFSPDHISRGTTVTPALKQSDSCRVTLALLNPGENQLHVEVFGRAGSVRVFQKSYEMSGNTKDRLTDSIVLHGEDIPVKENSIRFVASARDEAARPERTFHANADITIKQPPGTFSPHTFVGLVRTYDNTLQEIMNSFDIRYELIDSTLLASGNLDQFSVIVLDLRAYEYRQDAIMHSSMLLEYARKGGNLIVFYHKTFDWNGKNYAPYPLQLTTERVTEEDAPVIALQPHHVLLTTPNLIEPDDWKGWIQERSIYLPSNDTTLTSSKYERILAMSDENEHQPPTSLLWARYGEGSYSYISLALYRQLRILQNGAIKLLFNLISQPKKQS